MKQLLLKHGQGILTKEQKKFIIDTGKMPNPDTAIQRALESLDYKPTLEDMIIYC